MHRAFVIAGVRRAGAALALSIGLVWAPIGGSALTAGAATLQVAAVKGCLSRLQTGHGHLLTLNEAQHCAVGAPVLRPRAAASAGIAIVADGSRVIVEALSSSGSGAIPTASADGCWNDWHSYSDWWTDGPNSGSMWAAGYGNHCGYSDFPSNPTISISCICSSWSDSDGRYDSNDGQNWFGQDYAGAWGNVTYWNWVASDTFYPRIWIDPNANIWGTVY